MAVIIGLIAAIAVPNLLRARMSGNEASGIAPMRTLSAAQATFASTCGGGGYANTLADLELPPSCATVSRTSPCLPSSYVKKHNLR